MEPRIVKEIIDTETGEVEKIAPKEIRRVISEKTSEEIRSMMGYVVSDGTGRNSQVAGYEIGGKTGTSEDGVNTNKFIASFLGMAPVSNPQVVMLVILYNPTGEGGHQGGGTAAPIGSQVLGEVLPYLETTKVTEESPVVTVVDVRGKTIEEAKKELKSAGLTTNEINVEEGMEDVLVIEQEPKPGISVPVGSTIYLTI